MTDEQNWQTPGPTPPGQPAQPAAMPQQQPQAHPGYGPQPGYGQQPGYGYGQQPGWTPPPKPGLIPLRPLSFGTLIGAPFQVLRRNPKITVGAALLIQTIPSIVVSLLVFGGAALLLTRLANAESDDRAALTAGAIGGSIVLGLLSVVVSAVSQALLQGVVVGEVARGTVGEKLTFRALWRLVRGRIGALIGWTFLLTLGWMVVAALVVLIAVVLFALGGPAGIVGGILVLVLGGLGLVALAVWINTKLAMVPSAIVLERLGLRAAVARSWSLTGGYFWKTFGVIALIWLIVAAVSQIISIPFGIVGGLIGGIFAPTSMTDPNASEITQILVSQFSVNVLASIVGAIVGAILSVVQTSAVALLYIDLRMRKEGLDLELVRFVEARQLGRTDVPDPYRAPPRPAPGYASYPPPGGYQPPPGGYPPPPPPPSA
ncbi:hypothetical protein ACFVWR_03840 [Leifsonia sp. NPDC058292]|uniref:hypothetical protein n=1 Tax=Leifsonia sp. NPDC058292 TaxID=3346428 RepID=UPI0036D8EDA8